MSYPNTETPRGGSYGHKSCSDCGHRILDLTGYVECPECGSEAWG